MVSFMNNNLLQNILKKSRKINVFIELYKDLINYDLKLLNSINDFALKFLQ